VAAFAEGLAMLERFDLDQAAALTVLTKGAVGSPLVQTIAARIAADNFAPNFSVSLIAKDLAYAVHEAAAVGIDLTSAQAARARFLQAQAAGLGGQDIAALIKALRQPQNDQ
jgi:3-hydroxyisobutyrate dehydrogenase